MSRYRYEGRQGDRATLWDIMAPIAAFVIVAVLIIGTLFGIAQIGRAGCYHWGEITGREVQWRRVSIAPTCFVKTSDGHWLPKENLREVVD